MATPTRTAMLLLLVGLASMATAQRLPSGPLIAGYGTRCDGKSDVGDDRMVAEAVKGVNVIIWFATNLVKDATSGEPVVQNGPNTTCVALVAKELRRRGLPTAHMISIGGWDAPHPNVSFTGKEWWSAWRSWNAKHVAHPSLGFDGYDGIDWDLEGNDKNTSRWNVFTPECLTLVGEMSVAAKADGFIVSLVPPQSYFDVSTSRFSRSLTLAYSDWHPEFHYRGANSYSYLVAKYGEPTFDFVDIQLYESYSRACEAINGKGEKASDYLMRWAAAVQAGWQVDFSDDPTVKLPSQMVRVPASRLVIGFSRGGGNGKSVYIPPSEVAIAYKQMAPKDRPRGFMFWNMANDGGPVNGSKTGAVDFASSFNEILQVRPTPTPPMPLQLTAYRITPRNYTGLANFDSGDAAGDVYFGLFEFALPLICADQPDLLNCVNVPILSIPGFNVYTKTELEVDPRFAEYQGCNPSPTTGVFSCKAFDHNCWNATPAARSSFSGVCDPSECRCKAFDTEAAGLSVCNMCERNATWHHDTPIWRKVEDLGRLLNGSWFSTRAEGECKKPTDVIGVDCWWRSVRQLRNVNASCVSERVIATVKQHGAKCFASCGPIASHNVTSPCFIDCLFETLVGGSMTKAQIVAPFEQAFNSDDPSQGGCEEVPPCPPPCHPPAVEGVGVERGRRREPGSSLRVGLHLL